MIDTTRVKGVFLENAVRKLQRESTELKEAENAGSLEKVRAIKRRIKRAATNLLYNQELKLAAEKMTVQEFNRRKGILAQGDTLMGRIVKESKKDLEAASLLAKNDSCS